jgi:hypothetical protein
MFRYYYKECDCNYGNNILVPPDTAPSAAGKIISDL